MRDCPTCAHKLEEVSQEEATRLMGGCKDSDEEIWFCPECREYIFEEDFLYNTEE